MNQILNVPFIKRTYSDNAEIRSEDFIGELKEFEWLVYSYGSAPYEGSGNMIWKKDGKYYHHDMGHCSCYGWENDILDEGGFDSLEALFENSSESINEDVQPLLAALKEAGLS